ncbi:MAG TPA: hypothetical protein PLO65_00115 [Caulobacter sp.]|nr:hypothetical protein [Caulobacter sp.]
MPPKDIRAVLGRMIPEDERLRLRAELLKSYKAQHLPGAQCALCAQEHRPLALHVCDFYEDASCPPRTPALLIGKNSIGRRWSLPVCTECAPPCPKCGLPIVSGWIKKSVEALQAVPWARKAKIGLGICRHFHPLRDIASRAKKPYWTPESLSAETEETRRGVVEGAADRRHTKAEPRPSVPARKPSSSSDARAALERQFAGWDVGEFGGMTAFTRYHEQPSGFRLRVSLIPAAGHRINLFAALIPPPDELNTDRQEAIDSVGKVEIAVGSSSVALVEGELSLLGQHGVQLTGWFVFTDFLQKLSEADPRSGEIAIFLRTSEPFQSRLGGRCVTVPTDGLFETIRAVGEQIARNRG